MSNRTRRIQNLRAENRRLLQDISSLHRLCKLADVTGAVFSNLDQLTDNDLPQVAKDFAVFSKYQIGDDMTASVWFGRHPMMKS